MSDEDPRQRFTTRAAAYARGRPTYPRALVEAVLSRTGVAPGGLVADLGSGTGLFTRELLACGVCVAAVEPSAPMREAAEAVLSRWPGFRSVGGSAEATGLADASVDLVTCAQAFHWFDVERTRVELRRILRPPRWVALVWNTRRVELGFAAAYEALLQRFAPGYREQALHMGEGRDARVQRFFGQGAFERLCVAHAQAFEPQGLAAMLDSVSYLPAPGTPGHDAMQEEARSTFTRHAEGGRVVLPYDAEAFIGQV